MNRLKKVLLSTLGEKKYLSLLANSFQRLYKTGRLGSSYQDVYFLKKILGEGYYCVDIGAHLGYYTVEMSRRVSTTGKVYAIEPISKCYEVLENLLKRKHIRNVELFKVALGGDGEYVEMGIPKVDNMKKFAYARVLQSNMNFNYIESEKVKNESGDHLFLDLPRLDFIKCDVEGLEVPVFTSMMRTLEKYHPIFVCELADKADRITIYEMVKPLGYKAYLLKEKKLHLLDVHSDEKAISHNHYFIPVQHAERIKDLIIS